MSKVDRLGKRVVFGLESGLHIAIHPMISGRLRWRPAPLKGRDSLLHLAFPTGVLTLTEASKKRRAAVHVFADAAGLETLRRAGIDPLNAAFDDWHAAMRTGRRTLKRLRPIPTPCRVSATR